MDSKFLRVTLLVSLLFMVTIFFVVLYANGVGPGQKEEAQEVREEVIQEEILTGQIGNDLYGWMEDENFFDKAPVTEEEEEGAIRVNLIATSVEKDMRILVAGPDGKPVKGQFFKVIVDEKDEYKDLDRDGVIYIADLKAGEYKVMLEEQPGFVVPASPMPVKVKARVEYVAIGDISLLIKTEEEVDAMAEDAGRITEEADPTEPTELRTTSTANLGIDVSRWNEEINWNKVKDAGIKYAIIRTGYRGSVTGALVEDWYFKKNVEGATAAGIPVGLYFFTQATNEVEAVEEASMVLALCKDYDITYPIFIDTEGAGGNGRADTLDKKTRTAVCLAFCETIRKAGYETGIYASKNWFKKNIDTSILTDDVYIWLAEYGDAVTYEDKYHMWQYTSSGRVLGIEGRVDLNLSFLEPETKEELKYGDGPEEE
ncbi:MAG: glycoside hydrolase family 25 protein [Lachnospiraceae bacterium]|nr:glycoside hydrolase family 25 protein [Lachnospiraceae bacterium]